MEGGCERGWGFGGAEAGGSAAHARAGLQVRGGWASAKSGSAAYRPRTALCSYHAEPLPHLTYPAAPLLPCSLPTTWTGWWTAGAACPGGSSCMYALFMLGGGVMVVEEQCLGVGCSGGSRTVVGKGSPWLARARPHPARIAVPACPLLPNPPTPPSCNQPRQRVPRCAGQLNTPCPPVACTAGSLWVRWRPPSTTSRAA